MVMLDVFQSLKGILSDLDSFVKLKDNGEIRGFNP